jgi:DNA polymerase III sliding clamp (beta) subunit (PCNA family)
MMRATCERDVLVRLLELVKHAGQAESNAIMPLYTHVRIAVAKGALHTACLSMDGAARASVPLGGPRSHQDGACAVSFRRLYEVARSSAPGEILLDDETGTHLDIHALDGLTRLPVLPEPDALLDPWQLDIPTEAASYGVQAQDIWQALRAVRHAIAPREDARPAFRGVCLDVDPAWGAAAVATDGSRIAYVTLRGQADRPGATVLSPTGVDALLTALEGLTGHVQLDLHPTVALLDLDGVAVRVQGIASPFPPWRRVVAAFTESSTSCTVPVAQVEALCLRALSVVGDKVPVTVWVGPRGLALHAESLDGRVEGTVGPDYMEAQAVTLNPRFLAEACAACPEENVVLTILTGLAHHTADQDPVGISLRAGPWRACLMRRAP